jgi:hypothetical protein
MYSSLLAYTSPLAGTHLRLLCYCDLLELNHD